MTAETFLDVKEARLAAVTERMNRAYWDMTTRSDPEAEAAYVAAREEMVALLQAREEGAAVSAWRQETADPLLRRRLEILELLYLSHQGDRDLLSEIIARETAIETRYSRFRAVIHGNSLSDNDLLEILARTDDPQELETAYLASKEVGREVAPAVLEVVRLRNRLARDMGFPDYFAFSLRTQELDPERLRQTLDRLDAVTQPVFLREKAALDQRLANRFGIVPDALRPWHYRDRFFQSPPREEGGLDELLAGKELVPIARSFYRGIGLEIDGPLSRSDLFEREGKQQHAYCIDMDRRGDVRILANLRPDAQSLDTLLHELGHALYDLGIDPGLPYLLREAAHTATTEAAAMLMGGLTNDPDFLREAVGLTAAEAERLGREADRRHRLSEGIFTRWGLAVVAFEEALYRDPEQDLQSLWWHLVSRFQHLRPPQHREGAADWAAKIHIAVSPVYYQNYLLGQMLAAQFRSAATDGHRHPFVGRRENGRFLQERVFSPGASRRWDRLVEEATGEPLTPRHLARALEGGDR